MIDNTIQYYQIIWLLYLYIDLYKLTIEIQYKLQFRVAIPRGGDVLDI